MAEAPRRPTGESLPSSPKSHASQATDDVAIIRDVLTVQHIPVVGTLQWDKLQSLLHNFTDRLSNQGARLDKAEEAAKVIAALKDEMEHLSKKEAQEADWLKVIDDRMQTIEKGLGLLDLGELKTLPPRVSTLEDVTKDINASINGLEGELVSQALIQKDLLGKEQEREDAEAEESAHGMVAGDKLAALDSGFADMSDRLKRLELQIEALREMLIQTAKAQASDLEAIQNACRLSEHGSRVDKTNDTAEIQALRSDFENNTFVKPLEDAKNVGSSLSSKLGAAGDGVAERPAELELRKGRRAQASDQSKNCFNNSQKNCERKAGKRQSSMNKMFQELRDNLADLQDNVTSLAERSDLAVLLAKRAESIVQPVASIHGDMDSLDEEVTFVVNEHANRIMLYADMFLQLEVLIASKADCKQLQVLRDALTEFQNAGGMQMGEEMKATLKSHERMIMQLVEKVGVLGKGLLIMAGQDPAHDPAVAMQQAMEQIAKAEEGQRLRRASERAGTADAANAAANSVTFGRNAVYPPTNPSAFGAPLTHAASAGNSIGSNNQAGGMIMSQGLGGGGINSLGGGTNQNRVGSLSQAGGGGTQEGAAIHDQVGSRGYTSQGGIQGGGSSHQGSGVEGTGTNQSSSGGGGIVNQGSGGGNNLGAGNGRTTSHQAGGVHQSGDVIPLPADLVNPQIETHRGTTFSATRAIHQEAGPGPHRTSSLRIRSVEEASRMVLGTKYQETLGALEDALNANMIEPKEDMMVLARLVRQMENVILDLERHLAFIASLEEGLDAKADKSELQRLEKLVRESKAVQNAMLSGRPLLGFKCMSCDHPLQRLNPLRAEHVPTGIMPKSYLSMLSAERIFANENVRRDPSPPQSPPRTPPTAEMLRNAKGQQGGSDSARLRKTGIGGGGQGQQIPYNGSLPRRGSSAGKPSP